MKLFSGGVNKKPQSTALDFKSTVQLPPSCAFTRQFKVVFEVDSTYYRRCPTNSFLLDEQNFQSKTW